MSLLEQRTIRDFEILEMGFKDKPQEAFPGESRITNWPVVYILSNSNVKSHKVYVGETSNFISRIKQHRVNPSKQFAKAVQVIFDPHYTKSAVLDIEQSLIRLFAADGKFTIENQNAGQSSSHNYYQRELYQLKLPFIWEELHHRNLTDKTGLEPGRQNSLYN